MKTIQFFYDFVGQAPTLYIQARYPHAADNLIIGKIRELLEPFAVQPATANLYDTAYTVIEFCPNPYMNTEEKFKEWVQATVWPFIPEQWEIELIKV